MIKKLFHFFASLIAPRVVQATRDSVLQSPDRICGFMDVPEWGGRIYIATLTVAQRARFLEALSKLGSGNSAVEQAANYFRAQCELLADCVVSADSNALFTAADVDALTTKSPALVGRVYDEIVRLNGFSLVATEEAAKN